jgi:hypothetical protein
MIDLHDPNDCIGKYVDMNRDNHFVKERLDLLVEILGPKRPRGHEVCLL